MSDNINKISDQELVNVAGGAISPEEALERALAKAGLKKEQIDFLKKIEPDFEHGRKIFEVEFYKDGFEYEFDIDAASGDVLKFKKDWD